MSIQFSLLKLRQLKTQTLLRFLLLVASGWACLRLFFYFQPIVVIFTCAGILAFLLNYPTTLIARFIPRPFAATGVFMLAVLLLGGIIATIAFAIVAQGPAFLESVADFFNIIHQLSVSFEQFLDTRGIALNINGLEDSLRSEVLEQLGQTFSLVQDILGNIIGFVFIAVVAYFMLLDAGQSWQQLSGFISPSARGRVLVSIQRSFLGFFWGRLLLSLCLTASSFLIFLVLKVPQPLLMALIAGVFDLIPGIGATLGVILISLILLPQGLLLSIQVLISCIVLQQIEENLLMPRIMQQSLNMSPVLILLSLLIGHRLAGLFGVFLAIPTIGVLLDLGVSPEPSPSQAD